MLVQDIMQAIEEFAPVQYQEAYDNSGLQVGDPYALVKGVLLSLDVTEAIVDEALRRGCNMIVAHHPLLFSGLKTISGKTYIQRIVQKAIKNDINIYAAHTNLDNVFNGVNATIAQKLGLQNCAVLAPLAGTLCKLYTYAPLQVADKIRDALFAAGAGNIGNYSECSFNTHGTGTFRPGANATPSIGSAGGAREGVEEQKIEVILPAHLQSQVLKALFNAHPYEEVAYELVALQNNNQHIGAGIIGTLQSPLSEQDALLHIKNKLNATVIRHTALRGAKVGKIAVCGGSGSFLLKNAIQQGVN